MNNFATVFSSFFCAHSASKQAMCSGMKINDKMSFDFIYKLNCRSAKIGIVIRSLACEPKKQKNIDEKKSNSKSISCTNSSSQP